MPVAETQAGKGALPYGHPLALGAIGATGTRAANLVARDADLVLGIGTRYADFTTASRTAFQHTDVQVVNINVGARDAAKLAGCALVGDARATLEQLDLGTRGAPRLRALRGACQRRLVRGVGRRGRSPGRRSRGRAPDAGPGDRSGQRRRGRDGRDGVRGRQHAGRPPQAVAAPPSHGLPRRVRLLVHGLRGGRRTGRAPRRAGPRGLRDGRRRLVAADVIRARHRGRAGRCASPACWSTTTATARSAGSRARSGRMASAPPAPSASTSRRTPGASGAEAVRVDTLGELRAALAAAPGARALDGRRGRVRSR